MSTVFYASNLNSIRIQQISTARFDIKGYPQFQKSTTEQYVHRNFSSFFYAQVLSTPFAHTKGCG